MTNNKKGAILFIALAVVIIVVILSGVILSIVSSQSRLTNHQVNRIKAYYATKGIMNYVNEKLRTGAWVGDPAASGAVNRYACFEKGCLDSRTVFNNSYKIPDDADIPYKILVTIYPQNKALSNTVTRFDIKTEYTYTP